jgi:hypothetical protein
MPEQTIMNLEGKLETVLAQLKASHDPATRRLLLTEMRRLMLQLDRIVFDTTRFQPPPSAF